MVKLQKTKRYCHFVSLKSKRRFLNLKQHKIFILYKLVFDQFFIHLAHNVT